MYLSFQSLTETSCQQVEKWDKTWLSSDEKHAWTDTTTENLQKESTCAGPAKSLRHSMTAIISQAFHDSSDIDDTLRLDKNKRKTRQRKRRLEVQIVLHVLLFARGDPDGESRRGNSTEARGNPGWKFLRRRLRGWSQTGGSTLELVRFFNQNHGCHSHDQLCLDKFWYSMRKLALFIDQCYSQCLSLFLPFL